MSKPATITILDRKFCQARCFEQFIHHDGRARPKRSGLIFYMRYVDLDDKSSVMIQQTVNDKLNPKWLKEAVDKGFIYLEAYDHELTLAAAQANQ